MNNIEFVYRYIINSYGEIRLVNRYPVFRKEKNLTYVCIKNRKGDIEFKSIENHKILDSKHLIVDAESTLEMTDAAYLYYYCNEELDQRSIY